MTTINDHRHGGGRALTLAFLAAVIEGFDLQAAGVAVPKLAPAFGLTPQQIGLFFSAATFGLIFGALAGGRIADAWGRRTGLVIALVAFGVFSIATAYTATFEQLVVMRFLTGVGLGGALPNLVNIAAESTDPANRGKAVSIMYAGIPLGGAIASGVSMLGLHGGDWHSIFLIGGILPLILVPFVHFLLPPLAVVRAQVKSAGGALSQVFAPGTLATTAALNPAFFDLLADDAVISSETAATKRQMQAAAGLAPEPEDSSDGPDPPRSGEQRLDLVDLALHRADVGRDARVAELAGERTLAVGHPDPFTGGQPQHVDGVPRLVPGDQHRGPLRQLVDQEQRSAVGGQGVGLAHRPLNASRTRPKSPLCWARLASGWSSPRRAAKRLTSAAS